MAVPVPACRWAVGHACCNDGAQTVLTGGGRRAHAYAHSWPAAVAFEPVGVGGVDRPVPGVGLLDKHQ